MARQIVTARTSSSANSAPIFQALGMAEGVEAGSHATEPRGALLNTGAEAKKQRGGDPRGHRLQEIRVRRPWCGDESALPLLQRWRPDGSGSSPPSSSTPTLHYLADHSGPGRASPFWLFDHSSRGRSNSILDLCGQGRFTLFHRHRAARAGRPAVARGGTRRSARQSWVHLIGPRRKIRGCIGGDWAPGRGRSRFGLPASVRPQPAMSRGGRE